jgi:hypothetical protein
MSHSRSALESSLRGLAVVAGGLAGQRAVADKGDPLAVGAPLRVLFAAGVGQRRSPACAVHSQRSWRKLLAFQSGVSVAMTAAVPSGDRWASVISVVFRYSSSVMARLGGLRPIQSTNQTGSTNQTDVEAWILDNPGRQLSRDVHGCSRPA